MATTSFKLSLLALALALPAGLADGQACESTAALRAETVSGEISGAHAYSTPVNGNWRFELQPQRYGWEIAVIDADGQDRTALTPPMHLDTNPRQLSGWHFRNAGNTGTNEGDVNAPQDVRRFLIADDDGAPVPGVFNVRDRGLADLDPGMRARLVYLRFDACLYFPRSDEAQHAAADLASPDYLPEEIEQMRDCGLGAGHELDAWMLPRTLSGDFDGDGSIDLAALVRRTSDGLRDIAVCRAGTWMTYLGPGGAASTNSLAEYIQQAEAWQIERLEALHPAELSSAPVAAHGDLLSIERIEKQAYAVYWDGTQFRWFERYHHVEP
tara:strand:+ start:10340 stop:11317 length:978 start_codon:yes stop_codon:yes gene_type:complete